MAAGPDLERDVVAETTDLLVKALRALGEAGFPDRASRLAGRGWWVLQEAHPREAERLNGALHYLARLPVEADAPAIGTPAAVRPVTPQEET